MTENRASEKLV
ncbi:hypothetical protein A2U01_0101384, partial [Trifolium medium]|nr:hypothetical protein [Trifolium medium]